MLIIYRNWSKIWVDSFELQRQTLRVGYYITIKIDDTWIQQFDEKIMSTVYMFGRQNDFRLPCRHK